MKNRKFLTIFAFMFLMGTVSIAMPIEVKGATWGVATGKAWTITATAEGQNVKMSFQVTSVTTAGVKATMAGSAQGQCSKQENYEIGTAFVASKETLAIIAATATTKTETYGGVSCSCYVISGSTYDQTTGILLELTYSTITYKLTSWVFEDCGIPGYELPILLGITGIFSVGIIVYIRKKRVLA